MSYMEIYNDWCNNSYFDEMTRNELLEIKDNEKEIEDRFYKNLEFGTGGLRGVMGAGTNRMNKYTVRKATQGLANVILKENGENRGVAIAYDSRINSFEFAKETALCLNGNGIKTYMFETLRPTPELSFAVRHLNCMAGIVITASHNPPEYNGYKVYWEDGAQITYPKDVEIIEEVGKVTDFSMVKTMTEEDAKASGLFNVISEEVDAEYIKSVKNQIVHKDIIEDIAADLKIVYTPLHGSGSIPVQRILKEAGFKNVYVVKEQEKPDGNFPTVGYPNPENADVFNMALELAKDVDADIVLATDPDADRIGVYAKNAKTNEYERFNGNMSGSLIEEYILREKNAMGVLPENGVVVKTIVTTNLAAAIAKEYAVEVREVLTGFKYIGEQIKFMENDNSGQYIFGLEESYGCLAGTYARDKDACVAALLLCEIAAWSKSEGHTLCDEMNDVYEKYGYYRENLKSITLKGIDGMEKINHIMEALRNQPLKRVAQFDVETFWDYKSENRKNNLPKSNVLYFELEDDGWCCVRPSGTEPKIKLYMGVKGKSIEDADEKLEALEKAFLDAINMEEK